MTTAFADTFLFAACLAVAGAVLALIFRKPKVQQEAGQSDHQANVISMGH